MGYVLVRWAKDDTNSVFYMSKQIERTYTSVFSDQVRHKLSNFLTSTFVLWEVDWETLS